MPKRGIVPNKKFDEWWKKNMKTVKGGKSLGSRKKKYAR